MHRMPAAARTHLPIKPDIINSGIMEEDAAGRESEVIGSNYVPDTQINLSYI